MSLKDQAAVVGVGATPYYRRGQSLPQTPMEMACKAIMAACEDAGLPVTDVDGFALYSMAPVDPGTVAGILGLPEIRFAGTLTSGGGGASGSVGLAAAAIHAGLANVVVSLMTLQQAGRRLGGSSSAPVAPPSAGGGAPTEPPAACLPSPRSASRPVCHPRATTSRC